MTTRTSPARSCPSGDATARRVTLVIPGTPAYSLSPNARCHWAVKHRETRDAQLAVHYAIVNRDPYFPLMYGCPFDGKVKLHWTVYLPKGGKKRDMTNVLPSLKAHEDALVEYQIIPGDSPRWIPETPTVEQVTWSKHRGEPKITVTIEEAL